MARSYASESAASVAQTANTAIDTAAGNQFANGNFFSTATPAQAEDQPKKRRKLLNKEVVLEDGFKGISEDLFIAYVSIYCFCLALSRDVS